MKSGHCVKPGTGSVATPAATRNRTAAAIEEDAEKNHDFELWISTILRSGVILSLALLAVGTILTFWHHPDYWSDAAALKPLISPSAGAAHALREFRSALFAGRGAGFCTLGLLALIATPILRVAVAAVAFWFERDRAYVMITLTVLGLLLTSLFLGRVEG